MSSIYKTFNNKNSYLLLVASQIYIIISFFSSFYKTKTLKPWSDEIVSLVSNYNFYLNNFNFIGPYGTEYFTSYSPKLTAGPISSIGAVISWVFTDNIYIIRFSNFIYLFLLSILLLCIVLFTFNFEVKGNFILLTTLFLFSLTNTSWWYGILYLLPETICALIFANAILLFEKHRRISLLIMGISIFFGDFLTVLMFFGFYISTMYYERSLIRVLKDIPFGILPPIIWLSLVIFFSDYNLIDYFSEYYNHYFRHRSAGNVDFSSSSIVNNFVNSEVSNWGIADFTRILFAPILFSFIVIRFNILTSITNLGKAQILLPLLTVFTWFWLLSPVKSIIYSGLFTTFMLIFTSYLIVLAEFKKELVFYLLLTIYAFFFSSFFLIVIYMIFITLFFIIKKQKIQRKQILIILIFSMCLNQLNVIAETASLLTYEVTVKNCKASLTEVDCWDDYFEK